MQNFLFFKVENFHLKLKYSDILYIEAEKRYVSVVTSNKAHLSPVSITKLEKQLPAHLFCRIHRSYIISLEHLHKFDNDLAYVGDKKLPIAKQFRVLLMQAIAS